MDRLTLFMISESMKKVIQRNVTVAKVNVTDSKHTTTKLYEHGIHFEYFVKNPFASIKALTLCGFVSISLQSYWLGEEFILRILFIYTC